MQSLHLGILVFDLKRQSIYFRNLVAANLLAQLGEPGFDELGERLLKPGKKFEDLKESEVDDNRLTLGSRLYGYSLYRSGDFVWAYLRDVTERTRLEGIAESVEWMNSLGYVFSAVRHELGNPVNSIKTAVSVLRGGLDKFSRERVEEYLERIGGEISRVEQMLRSLKNFSLFEEPSLQSVDLNSFIHQFKRLIVPDLQARGISLAVEVDPGLPLVSADPRAIQQILINLLANATDAVDGQIDPAISIRVFAEEGRIMISVEDNGTGIAEQHLPRLFTPFFTTKEKGTGLGLVIVKKMVTRMNGTIRAECGTPKGTRVLFSLELA
jgi:C4-dicarboxylate-specific signal transduction histidine kinase